MSFIEYELLVRSLLSVDISSRPYIAEVNAHMWMTALPSYRPSWEGTCGSKYTIENSLPSILHGVPPHNTCCHDVAIPYPPLPPQLPSMDQQGIGMDAANMAGIETNGPISTSPSEVYGNYPVTDSDTSALAISVSSISLTSVQHLHDPVDDPIISAELVPSRSVNNLPEPCSDSCLIESAPSSSLEQENPPPDALTQSVVSVTLHSLERDVQPSNSARITFEELELPGVVEHTDCHSTGASNTAMPAIQGDASRPGQRKRRRRHLVARLKDAVGQRLFTYLRKNILVL